MVSAQERLTRTFTRSSHTYTRTERTEISKTRGGGGETKREVRVEKSTQVAGDPFSTRDPFGDFLGPEGLTGFNGMLQEGVCVRVCNQSNSNPQGFINLEKLCEAQQSFRQSLQQQLMSTNLINWPLFPPDPQARPGVPGRWRPR